ncbi:hypothetical protein RAS1_29610 [Phycisphaerae bacterium RAS1]|nr:hypothetical protein RAS1_29610 [Phycisphaerae bacterium RAS1]
MTDIAALIRVSNAVPHTQVRFIPTLHAKAYVADVQEAIVTSANMTDAGLFRNLEYGVYFDDPTLVRQIRHDIEGYGHLGPRVPLATLDQLAEAAGKVEVEQRVVNDSAAKAARAALRRLLTNADDLVLAARTAGRSLTAILEDTVLYLLKKSPLPTTEIHARVQQIHPDLCDDSVHRMIAGRSYGKRWKHSVRTAQSHLKERGFAVLRDGLWTLAPGWQSDRAVPIIPPDE